MHIKHLFRSLAHRNFRLFFFGQSISLIGTWMQQIAMSWLVFQMTGSSFKLGVVMFLANIPCLFLSPFIGVLIDRWNRHHIVIIAQVLAMAQALILAFLTLTHQIVLWEIYSLAFFIGIVTAIDITARQTFMMDMVAGHDDLGNAIALNASMFNGARLIGPSIAGLLLAATSAGVCFLVNGISYSAVLIALIMMRLPPPLRKYQTKSLAASLREGVAYVARTTPIRNILLLAALGSMTGGSFLVLMPEFTVSTLHGGARTLGWLTAAAGCGAFFGALFLASRKTVIGLGKWLAAGVSIMGIGLIVLSKTDVLILSVLVLIAIGFGLITHLASSNTILQTVADEDKRGRVISFYTLAFMGTAPLGNLLTGYLSSAFDPLIAMKINGCLCLLGGLLFIKQMPQMRKDLRPIYRQLHILPVVEH